MGPINSLRVQPKNLILQCSCHTTLCRQKKTSLLSNLTRQKEYALSYDISNGSNVLGSVGWLSRDIYISYVQKGRLSPVLSTDHSVAVKKTQTKYSK